MNDWKVLWITFRVGPWQWCSLEMLGVLVLASTVLTLPAMAQSAPQPAMVPGTGEIHQNIQQPVMPPTGVLPEIQKKQEQDIDLSPIEFEPVEDTVNREIRFTTRKIILKGNTLLSQRTVTTAAAPLENASVTFSELSNLATHLTALIRQKGYVTSEVVIPPQRIENGTVILQAQEGRVGTVQLSEGRYFKAAAIKRQLLTHSDDIFDINALRQSLRQINLNPDLQLTADLKPGQNPLTTDIVLHIQDQLPLHVTPFWDNLGRELIGKSRLGFSVTHNNLLGLADQDQANLSWTRRSFGFYNRAVLPLNNVGTNGVFEYAFSTLRLGGGLARYNITGRSSAYSPQLEQFIFNRPTFKLYANLAFDFKNLQTDLAGSPLYDDRLRILRPSIHMDWWDRWGRTIAQQEVAIGLPLFNATAGNSAMASRPGAGSHFLRLAGSVTRIQRLPLETIGILRANYQASGNRLVSSEQIQAGGAYTVRGYLEGAAIGDSGLLASAELYHAMRCFPQKWHLPFHEQPLNQAVQMVLFSDFGTTWSKRNDGNQRDSIVLAGIGAGLRVQLTKYLTGRVDIGIPLIRHNPDRMRPRLHFGIQAPLF